MVNRLAKLAGIKASPVEMAPDMRYRAEDALRTITRAEECRRDKALMREVKKLAKTQVKAVCK